MYLAVSFGILLLLYGLFPTLTGPDVPSLLSSLGISIAVLVILYLMLKPLVV